MYFLTPIGGMYDNIPYSKNKEISNDFNIDNISSFNRRFNCGLISSNRRANLPHLLGYTNMSRWALFVVNLSSGEKYLNIIDNPCPKCKKGEMIYTTFPNGCLVQCNNCMYRINHKSAKV